MVMESEEGRKQMKKLMMIAGIGMVLSTVALAAPLACPAPPPPAVTVATVGAGVSAFTYTCDGLTFNNFSAVDFGNSTGIIVTLGSGTFDPVTGRVVLAFSPNLTNPTLLQDIHLFFTVTGPLLGIDLGVGGTNATVTERACKVGIDAASGNCMGGLTNQLAALTNFSGAADVNASFASNSPTFIFKDIGHTVSGDITAFSESFTTGVPEPMTLSLVGAGLLGLGLVGRRRRNRKS
jgi:hypothetical protein